MAGGPWRNVTVAGGTDWRRRWPERRLHYGQPSLPFRTLPTPDKHGLLLAAFPEARLAAICVAYGLDAVRRGYYDGPLVAPHRLHVTLFYAGFLDALPAYAVTCLAEVLDVLSFDPIPILFDKVIFGRKSLLLGCSADRADVARFTKRLRRALGEAHWPWSTEHRFSPHITLGYGPCRPGPSWIMPVQATILRMRMLHSAHGEGEHRQPAGGPDGPDIVQTNRGRIAPRLGSLPNQMSLPL